MNIPQDWILFISKATTRLLTLLSETFEVIGEASKNLSQDIKDNYPNVPWEEMYRLRNRISHEYFGIDYEIIWDIISRHLPNNRKDIKIILDNERQKE